MTEQANKQVVEHKADIIEAVSANPGTVLLDRESFSAFVERLRADAPTEIDISKKKDRDALKSYAAGISRHKAAIDKDRLKLTAEWRRMTTEANDAGKLITAELTELAAEIRKPLTDWEEAEEKRETLVDTWLKTFMSARYVEMSETSESINARGFEIVEMVVTEEVFRDRFDEAVQAQKDTVAHLLSARDLKKQAEADAAELEKLRKDREEADQREREREQAEQAKREEAEAEARREQDERDKAEADRQRIEREREDATQAALAEAENKRVYARQIIDHIREVGQGRINKQPYSYPHLIRELEEKIIIDDSLGDQQEAVRTVRDATLELLKAAQTRADEVAAENARKAREEAEQRRTEEENRQRAANQEHRRKIKTAAKEAIMAVGVSEEQAVAIVTSIVEGRVPHVKIEF